MELHSRKTGRPSTLPPETLNSLKLYLADLRKFGGIVNSAIVLAAATGIAQRSDPALPIDGSLSLTKSWAKHFLKKNNFVKRKATTKAKVYVPNFVSLQAQFLQDIKVVVQLEDIPFPLIVNWDQTGINYVPVSQWTMEQRGSKMVEVAGINDKRQITAVYGGTMDGDFLPVQLVYQGKTEKCLPKVDFPSEWHITCTPNHWCNEKTVLDYVKVILVPYLQKKKDLGLVPTHPALVLFDEFNGQTTNDVLELLELHNIYYVIIPPNTTDRLQPLDLSINKAAKDFLRSRFNLWYAEKIQSQMTETESSNTSIKPVDMKLSTMKPIGARWLMDMFDYFKGKPDIIKKGFHAAGITANYLKH